jgi:hypothetical protein
VISFYNLSSELETKYGQVVHPTPLVDVYKNYCANRKNDYTSLQFNQADSKHFFRIVMNTLAETTGWQTSMISAKTVDKQATWSCSIYYSARYYLLLLTSADFIIQLNLEEELIGSVKGVFSDKVRHLALEVPFSNFAKDQVYIVQTAVFKDVDYWIRKLRARVELKSFTALIGGVQDTDLFQVISLRASPDEDWPGTVAEAVTSAVIPFACAGNSNMKLVMVFNL